MTKLLLIRHGECDTLSTRLAGRSSGIRLNDTGRAQAQRLAARLAPVRLAAIYTSPLERARETAEPIAASQGLPLRTLDAFVEIDFGAWTGRAFDDLRADPGWVRFNAFRATSRPQGGETLQEAVVRAWQGVERIASDWPEATVAAVTHADVIRSLLSCIAGIPLDLAARTRIDTASITTFALSDARVEVLGVNDTGDVAALRS